MKFPPKVGDSFHHAPIPEAGRFALEDRGRIEAPPIVLDRDDNGLTIWCQRETDLAGVRVSHHVVEGLLDKAVDVDLGLV